MRLASFLKLQSTFMMMTTMMIITMTLVMVMVITNGDHMNQDGHCFETERQKFDTFGHLCQSHCVAYINQPLPCSVLHFDNGLHFRTSYKDYSLQSRLHFRIHAAQNQLREVLIKISFLFFFSHIHFQQTRTHPKLNSFLCLFLEPFPLINIEK